MLSFPFFYWCVSRPRFSTLFSVIIINNSCSLLFCSLLSASFSLLGLLPFSFFWFAIPSNIFLPVYSNLIFSRYPLIIIIKFVIHFFSIHYSYLPLLSHYLLHSFFQFLFFLLCRVLITSFDVAFLSVSLSIFLILVVIILRFPRLVFTFCIIPFLSVLFLCCVISFQSRIFAFLSRVHHFVFSRLAVTSYMSFFDFLAFSTRNFILLFVVLFCLHRSGFSWFAVISYMFLLFFMCPIILFQ